VAASSRYVVCFGLLQLLLKMFKKNKERLESWAVFGSHFVGFIAADCFGTWQEAQPWDDSELFSLLWILISAAILGLLAFTTNKLRAPQPPAAPSAAAAAGGAAEGATPAAAEGGEAAATNSTPDEGTMAFLTGGVEDPGEPVDPEYIRQCERAEDGYIAMTMGLLLMQSFRFAIVGALPHFSGVQVYTHASDVRYMGIFALVCLLLSLACVKMPARVRSTRLFAVTQMVLTMTMGWSVLYWFKWLFPFLMDSEGLFNGSDIMTSVIFMATLATIFGFALVLAIGKANTRWGFRGALFNYIEDFTEALVLVMGLAWESVVMCAIYYANKSKTSQAKRILSSMELCLTIVALVVPVWLLYVLPKARELVPDDGKKADAVDEPLADSLDGPDEPAAPQSTEAGVAAPPSAETEAPPTSPPAPPAAPGVAEEEF